MQHWHSQRDSEDIEWLTLDCAGKRVNTLSSAVIDELAQLTEQYEQSPPRAVVLRSAKSGFIAGADITEFAQCERSPQAVSMVRSVQQLFDRWQQLSCTTIACIQGFCLGGGLELALACDLRITDDAAKTVLGLPEVKLGLQPGWGGTVRLTQLIGVRQALALMLVGRTVNGRRAKRLGLVDACVSERQLQAAVRACAMAPVPRRRAPWLDRCLSIAWVRPWVARWLLKSAQAKVNFEHYPAVPAMIDQWRQYGAQGEAAYVGEAESIVQLMRTDTAKQLQYLFFLQERLKRRPDGVNTSVARVHVIGAGTMGGDIAAWCALQGLVVTLQDLSAGQCGQAVKRADRLFQRRLKAKHLVQAAHDRLMIDPDGEGVKLADLVIEAVVERLDVKQQLFVDLEGRMKPDALLASNTSSIPLESIASVLKQPERCVGIHFFNPVAAMQLVEVVVGSQTSTQIRDRAQAFVQQIKRLPVVVKSCPGFLVNRVLMPYMMEAMQLLEEGVSAEAIDQAACQWGMPMGPVALADQVGLDVCLMVVQTLAPHMNVQVPKGLQQRVDQGHLGKKTQRGFYWYPKKRPVWTVGGSSMPEDGLDRMMGRMLNEAVSCLQEQVVADEQLLDAAMVFGTGFAPFRGGVMSAARQRGRGQWYQCLQALSERHGERFTPVSADWWHEQAPSAETVLDQVVESL